MRELVLRFFAMASPLPAADAVDRPSYLRQVIDNQVWEALGIVAKLAFLVVLTPMMIANWGPAGYGYFAVGSSCVAMASALDFGLRARLRVALGRDSSNPHEVVASALHDLVRVCVLVDVVVAVALAIALTETSWNSEVATLGVIALLATQVHMATNFMLEPAIAQGRIGRLKLVSAVGVALSIPVVWTILSMQGKPSWALGGMLLSWIVPNIAVVLRAGTLERVVKAFRRTPGSLSGLGSGLWFNATTVAWMGKGHGLTLLIAAVSGPVDAGVFFLILRVAELVGAFGSISSDVAMSQMASVDLHRRREAWRVAYRMSLITTLIMSLFAGALAPWGWQHWLGESPPIGWATGWLAALMGISLGANRLLVYAAMATGRGKLAGICGVTEAALAVALAWLAQLHLGLPATIVFASLAGLALIPIALALSRDLRMSPAQTWSPFAPKEK